MLRLYTLRWSLVLHQCVGLLLLAVFSFSCGSWAAGATPPAWWQGRGVLVPGAAADDFAVLNQGQLKHLAAAAAAEMNAKLPGGAGTAVNATVQGWTASAATADDYAAATVGQLKAAAAPFYDRMIALGVLSSRPWTVTTADDDDFTAVTVGQAKFVFSFPINFLSLVQPRTLLSNVTIPDPNNMGYSSQVSSYTPPAAQPGNWSALPVGAPKNFDFYTFKAPTGVDAEPYIDWETRWVIRFWNAQYDPQTTGDSEWWHYNSDYPSYISSYVRDEGSLPSSWSGPGVTYQWGGITQFTLPWYTHSPLAYWDYPYWEYPDPEPPPVWVYQGAERREWVSRLAVVPPASGAPIPPHKTVTRRYQLWRYINGEPVAAVGSAQTFAIGAASNHSSQTVHVSPSLETESMDDEFYWMFELPDLQPFTLTTQDAAGPKYRKVALNGVPLSDSKPQNQDESGEVSEETFVDAYTRQLRHSVSDVYVSVGSSLLPLTVRREVIPETWSPSSGLRPEERPDRPFGLGWSSNLTPHIAFVDDWKRAVVTDEQGVTRTFIRHPEDGSWRHSHEERQDGKTAFDTLEEEYTESGDVIYVLRKKFGTTCYYPESGMVYQTFPKDRVNGSDRSDYITYARISEVTDRLGNTLNYEYPPSLDPNTTPPPSTLIPSRIYDEQRPALQLSIQQSGGRIVCVKGPSGEMINYGYNSTDIAWTPGGGDAGDALPAYVPTLATVTRGGDSVTYGHQIRREVQQPEVALGETLPIFHYHIDLSSITDERGKIYSFTHEPFPYDPARIAVRYTQLVENATLVRIQHGLPSLLKSVVLPTGAEITFDEGSQRKFLVNQDGTLAEAIVNTSVRGPCGTYDYAFTEPDLFRPVLPDPGLEHLDSQRLTLTFTRLDITSAAGTETFTFNPTAGMGLESVTDFSGNVTAFEYADAWSGANGQSGLYDDPTSETNALGDTKTYTYDDDTRVMASINDERGVKTIYEIQPDTGTGLRTKETVTDSSGILRITDFEYDSEGFVGFLKKRTVQQGSGAASPHAPAIVTEFTPDADGRVGTESVVLAGNQRLTTSYTYTPSGSKASVTDPRGYTTLFTYDPNTLRLETVTYPGGSDKNLYYDAHGNLTGEKNENGVKTFHEYDDLNRRILSAVDGDANGKVRDANGPIIARATTSIPGEGNIPWFYNGDIITETSYNAFNLPETITDPRGLVTKHGYDSIGRLKKTIVKPAANGLPDADSLVTTFDYSGPNSGGSVFDVSGFKPTQATSPRGVVTEVDYDKLYRAKDTRVIDPMASPPATYATHTDYDKVGNPTHVTDALGRTTVTQYDGLNRPTKIDLPSGGVFSVPAASRHTFYTPSGNVWKSVDEAGRETLTHYDAAGRPYWTQGPELENGTRPETKTYYDASSNPIAVTNPNGYTTETEYDERNRPVTVTAPPIVDAITGQSARPITRSTYDGVGKVLTVTDATGHTTTTVYDRSGRVARVTNPLNQSASSVCDAAGNVHTVIDPNGHPTSNQYDDFGRLSVTMDATNRVTEFDYDKAGNRKLVDVLDDAPLEAPFTRTLFTYDGLNRLLTETHANGDQTTFTYDALHKLTRSDAAGITDYGYDVRDRLKTVSPPGCPSRTNSYDAASRLLSVTETGNPAADVGYTYDALGRVLTETSRGLTHGHSYDLAGNRLTTDYADGRSEVRTYDGLNRIVTLTEGGRVTTWHYDLAGLAIGLKLPNGQQQDNYPDNAGRLTDRHLFGTGSGLLASFEWKHDDAGNVREQSEQWFGNLRSGQRTTAMGYDEANRLLTETIIASGQPTTQTIYTYDHAGNRDTKAETSNGLVQKDVDYDYNNANQLTGWTEKDGAGTLLRSAVLDYDGNGNRESQTITPAGGAAQLTIYGWTSENRLAGVSLPDGSTHAYTYDYRVRRISRSEPGSGGGSPPAISAMTYSGGLSVAEYAVTDASSSIQNPASILVSYQRGPDMGGGVGGLLYSIRPSSIENPASSIKFNLSNGRGDVVAQSDSLGVLTWTASYEAYGKRPVETGGNADRQRANTKEEDPTGLLNEGFRYRDLETGVWLSRDPAGLVDGPNLYAYVRCNPWSKFDPNGLYEQDFHFGAVYHILRAKGYDAPTSHRIAGFSQYVDDNKTTEPIYTSEKNRAEHHFIGSGPSKATTRDNAESRGRVEDGWRRMQAGDTDAAYRLGDALHGYADTSSHDGFTAWHNDKINTRTGSASRPNTGHADAAENGHAPDRPYNDVNKVIATAKSIYEMTPNAPGGKVLPWNEVQKDLEAAFEYNPGTPDDAENERMRIVNMRNANQKRFGERPIYSKSQFDKESSQFEATMKTQDEERSKKK